MDNIIIIYTSYLVFFPSNTPNPITGYIKKTELYTPYKWIGQHKVNYE